MVAVAGIRPMSAAARLWASCASRRRACIVRVSGRYFTHLQVCLRSPRCLAMEARHSSGRTVPHPFEEGLLRATRWISRRPRDSAADASSCVRRVGCASIERGMSRRSGGRIVSIPRRPEFVGFLTQHPDARLDLRLVRDGHEHRRNSSWNPDHHRHSFLRFHRRIDLTGMITASPFGHLVQSATQAAPSGPAQCRHRSTGSGRTPSGPDGASRIRPRPTRSGRVRRSG
jgi:hypothetical protein